MPSKTLIGVTLGLITAAQSSGESGDSPDRGAPAVCHGLIAEWRFESNAIDGSGNSNHGAIVDPAFTAGVAGQALQLNGSSTYASFPDSPSLNPTSAMTISAWYRPVPFAGSGSDPVVDKGASSHNPPYYQYHIGVSGSLYPAPGSIGGVFSLNGNSAGAGTPLQFLANDRWYHVVSLYDGTSVKFYADGVLISSNPATGTITAYGRPVQVGKFNNLNFYLHGTVDEVRMFDRAISPEEVDLLFRSPDARPMVIPAAINTCPGGTVTLTARHLAFSGAQYQWRKGGEPLLNQNNATLVLTNAGTETPGTYDCIVTTDCSTQTSLPAVVTLCQGDLNADATRNTADLTLLLSTFGQSVPPCTAGDLTGDGTVNTADLTTLLARFGQGC